MYNLGLCLRSEGGF